jgi:hypothetical protein
MASNSQKPLKAQTRVRPPKTKRKREPRRVNFTSDPWYQAAAIAMSAAKTSPRRDAA